MTQQTVNLAARLRQQVQLTGQYFILMSTGAAVNIECWLMNGTTEVEHIRTAARGFKARGGFTHVDMQSTVNCTCEVVISSGQVDFDFVSGTTVNANIVGQPVLVSNDRGSPGNLLYVSGITVADAPATSAANNAPVACSAVVASLVLANANRRTLRVCNLGPDPVTIGPATVTWANRVITLLVGDVWVEERGANLAWSAITDAAKAASVTAQEIVA